MANWRKKMTTTARTVGDVRYCTFYLAEAKHEVGAAIAGADDAFSESPTDCGSGESVRRGALMCRVWFDNGDHEAVSVDEALSEEELVALDAITDKLRDAALCALGYEREEEVGDGEHDGG